MANFGAIIKCPDCGMSMERRGICLFVCRFDKVFKYVSIKQLKEAYGVNEHDINRN
jgi:hypothetical protein